jgi:prophage regulatory protein
MQKTLYGSLIQDPLLKLPTVIEVTGNSRSKIYSDIKEGLFPAPLKTGKRAVAWKLSDIEGWINSLQTKQEGSKL